MTTRSGGRGDDAPRPLQPGDDGLVVADAALVQLDDAGQQEHLVVHRQPEPERQHQHRDRRLDRPDRVEAQQPLEVALLEDPHDDAQAGAERDDVHQQRLDRDDHRPGHEEEQHQGGEGDQGEGVWARARAASR